jgi:CelD/BcsL family acetyltransferase involved in cellulose biosynthesis
LHVVDIEVVHPSELGSAEIRAWSSLQSSSPEFGSPLLGPQFARLVGELRRDARTAIWRDGRRAAGFLGFHKTVGGFARPIGAPFSDYHALVCAPGRARAELSLEAAGLTGIRMTGLIDPHGVFAEGLEAVAAHRIDLAAGAEPYLADLWRSSRNRWRNFKRYSRHLAGELGPLRIEAPDASAATFERLIGWKRRQLAGAGLHDFTGSPWVSALFHQLFEIGDPAFGGLMITLYAGERPVAAHFGVRQDGWFHPWIGAYDPDLSAHSPGLVHQVMAAEAAAGIGIHTYDLGPRADRSKAMFANSSTLVRAGWATGRSLPGRLAVEADRMLAPAGSLGLLGRVRNRWDHVASVELTLGGRIAGMAHAAASLNRRMAAWKQAA